MGQYLFTSFFNAFSRSLLSLTHSLSSQLGRSMSPEMEMQHRNSQVRMTTSPTSGYYDAHGSHEHYERIECTYIGSCEVSQAMGMEILNEAVDRLSTVSHRWLNVNIDVATSNIKISDTTVSTVD